MKYIILLLLLFWCQLLPAQKVDSIYVHLYTDSLKKGTYNYINIDGKLANGRFTPLDTSEINFSASAGEFFGNSLLLDRDFSQDSVEIKAVLRSDPRVYKQFILYIKQAPDPELPTEKQLMEKMKKRKRGKNA